MVRKQRGSDQRRPLLTPSPPEPASRRQIVIQGIVVFAVALTLRALHLWQMSGTLLYQVLISDPRQYDAWAQQIVAGDWLGTEVFYQTPLYPYLLACLYKIFGHDFWVIRIAQALFGATACVLLARGAARWFSERVGWVAGLLLAAFPPAIFFDGILQKASLDLLLVSGLMWALAVAQDLPRWWRFGIVGLLVGATTLNRENAAVLVPVLLGWIVWRSWTGRPRTTVAWCAAFTLGVALILVPVGARNYHVGGMFALTTSQLGPNFYIGNRAEAQGTYESLRPGRGDPRYEREDARLLAEQAMGRSLSPAEISRYWLRRAGAEMTAAPQRALELMGRKLLWTFNGYELIDSESLYTHTRYSTVLKLFSPIWHFGTLTPLALVGIWFTRRDARRLMVLYAIIVAMAAAVALFYVFARYRYPLAPVLILFAAAGFVEIGRRMYERDWQPLWDLGIAGALLVGGLLLCNQPVDLPRSDDDAVTFFNVGTELSQSGRIDDAVKMWQLALAEDARIPETYHHLGRAALAAGDLAKAQQYFERGRKLDPRQAMFPLNLAILAAERQDPTTARKLLLETMELDPQAVAVIPGLAADAARRRQFLSAVLLDRFVVELRPSDLPARLHLIAVLQAAGDDRAAVVELRAALQLAPKQPDLRNNLAWLLVTSRDASVYRPQEALEIAQSLCEETQMSRAAFLDTLAIAYSEIGHYEQAIETCQRALALNPVDPLAQQLREHLARFEAGQPWREVQEP